MIKTINTNSPAVTLDGKVIDFKSIEILPPQDEEDLRIKLILLDGDVVHDNGSRIRVEFKAPK